MVSFMYWTTALHCLRTLNPKSQEEGTCKSQRRLNRNVIHFILMACEEDKKNKAKKS